MSILVGVPKEVAPGERRVAMVPRAFAALQKSGVELLVEPGAGERSGYPDAEYVEKGARLAANRDDLYAAADVLLYVRVPGSWQDGSAAADGDLARLRPGQVLIGFADPLSLPAASRELAARGVTTFSMELMPRITRAQGMDALSSMATLSGYKAVLLAADALPRMFPMLMTAAGTVTPARVLIIGAGVAGLFAAATARRLGGVVTAYDVRPASREQVESVGAKFLSLPLESSGSEDRGGYAREMDADFYRRQRELMTGAVKEHDVVITTAAVPGKRAPVLVTRDMVAGMAPGSVIVDLAAERGGNCELTRPGETVVESQVTILGPLNLPATVPYHASQLYARNVASFLVHLLRDGRPATAAAGAATEPWSGLAIDTGDEITRETLVTRDGEVVHDRVRQLLGLTPPADAGTGNGQGEPPPGRAPASIERRPSASSASGKNPFSLVEDPSMDTDLEVGLYVFMLATFVGVEVIRRVSPLLHTPLMSLTNAISAIAVVGAILITGARGASTLSRVLGFIAVTASTTNIVSGFLITDRMLKMFRKREPQKP